MKTLGNLIAPAATLLLAISSQAADEAQIEKHRKAAEQGSAFEQATLGSCYQYGKGVSSNSVEALKWLNLSAAQDYDLARKTQSEIRNLMTKEQIAEAQRLAGEFKPKQSP